MDWQRVTEAGPRRHCCPCSKVCLRLPGSYWGSQPSVPRLYLFQDCPSKLKKTKTQRSNDSFYFGWFQNSRGASVHASGLVVCLDFNLVAGASCLPIFRMMDPTVKISFLSLLCGWTLGSTIAPGTFWETLLVPSLHSCHSMGWAAFSPAVVVLPCIASANVCAGL